MVARAGTDEMTKPKFFKTQGEFHEWLVKHHDSKTELLVGFHKNSSGKKSITYPEALDEALCFGWIDGVRKSIDETSYSIRFTPRKPQSIWSNVNVRHVERLKKAGLMQPSGLAAYALREDKRTGVYSFENRPKELSEQYQQEFKAKMKAWEFFKAQPTYYTKVCSFWVMSAKKEETRLRRLNQLIEISQKEQRLGLLNLPKKPK
jgi:uncharacterized protein YdeI (YjbR/CyaY-like superfamily)